MIEIRELEEELKISLEQDKQEILELSACERIEFMFETVDAYANSQSKRKLIRMVLEDFRLSESEDNDNIITNIIKRNLAVMLEKIGNNWIKELEEEEEDKIF